MSSAAEPAKLIHLVADAQFPTASISVIDGHYGLAAQGVGRLQVDLPPGLYVVQFKAGSAYEEQYVALDPQIGSVAVHAETLTSPISAAATETQPAPQVQVLKSIGSGSQLCLIVDVPEFPAAGMLLLDATGHVLLKIYPDIQNDRLSPLSTLAWRVELNPGTFLLRADTGGSDAAEQVIVASSGWQTLVYLRGERHIAKIQEWSQILASALILMTSPNDELVLHDRDQEWIDVALQNLASGAALAPESELRDAVLSANQLREADLPPEMMRMMFREKFTDPMLGIVGAHLMISSPNPDKMLLGEVVENLEFLVPGHPDIVALKLWLGQPVAQDLSFTLPPMLRSSWKIIVERTVDFANLIPGNSYAARVTGSVRDGGAWLVWSVPKSTFDFSAASQQPIEQLVESAWQLTLDCLEGLYESDFRVVRQRKNLNNQEWALFQYFVNLARVNRSSMALITALYGSGRLAGVWSSVKQWLPGVSFVPKDKIISTSHTMQSERLTVAALVKSLEVPQSVLDQNLASLVGKLTPAR